MNKRVLECAVKIANYVNAVSSHLNDDEAFNLVIELIARLERAKVRQDKVRNYATQLAKKANKKAS